MMKKLFGGVVLVYVIGTIVLTFLSGIAAGLALAYATGKIGQEYDVEPPAEIQTKSGVLTGDDELFGTGDFLAYVSSAQGRLGPSATLNIMLRGGYDVPVSGTELKLDGTDVLRWADIIVVTFARCGMEICYTATFDESKINVTGRPECETDGFRFHFKPYTIVDYADLANGYMLVKDYSDLKLYREYTDGSDTLIDEAPFPAEGQTVTFAGTNVKVKMCRELLYYSARLAY